jgi:2-oxo-3-hexenedioate decarboxylase
VAAARFTEELISLHAVPREVPPFSERFANLTPEEGYAAARGLHAHRFAAGWRPVGRKIGFTNRTAWTNYGADEPMWGTIYECTLLYAENDEATVLLAGLVNPRIEPELCFRLRAAPQQSNDLEQLLTSIDWMAHAVEVAQCHHPGWRFKLPDSIADNGLHGRLIVGTPIKTTRVTNIVERLVDVEVILRKDGAEVERGVGANGQDDPPSSPAMRQGWVDRTGVSSTTAGQPATACAA